MKKSTQWGSFIRRLSVFYIFFAVLVILFLIYYYYYIPSNQAEFNDRANRELKRLENNFNKKSDDLENTFREIANADAFRNKQGAYETLNQNIPYELDTITHDTLKTPDIRNVHGWSIRYHLKDPREKVFVRIDDFAKPLFESRNDIFDSYELLLADDLPGTSRSGWSVIFKPGNLTSSDRLTLDTLAGLQRNSDLSAVIDIRIGGNERKLFFQPFQFNGQPVAIAGLISKKNYNGYIRNTPVRFIASCVILLIIIFILLPFIKVFFLSPNEIISSKDVVFNTLSIFLGTAALLVISNYLYVYNISEQSFHNRMKDLANQVKTDIESEFEKADTQLNYYIRTYDSLSEPEKDILCYDTTRLDAKTSVDMKFCPRIYPNMTRVLWIDSVGNTLAKWNPFTFSTSLTNVSSYEFFRRLKASNENAVARSLIIYPGKSNSTGEYQVYIAKLSRQLIKTNDDKSPFVHSMGVLLAASLNCNMYPVMPPGFSFCVIDSKGNILVHSDSRRNLSENILVETGENSNLVDAINYRNASMIKDLVIYGKHQDLYIKPLKGQPLSLVVLFNKRSIVNNISRLLHFSIACLLYLFLIMAGVLFFSTYGRSANPHKIKFNLKKVEWIRPSAGNKYSYEFTRKFFSWLSVFYIVVFLVILIFKLDIRNLLYFSLVMPLYTIWGFIISRKHLVNKFIDESSLPTRYNRLWNTLLRCFIDAKSVILIWFLFNVALFYTVAKGETRATTANLIFLVFVQLISLLMLIYHYLVMIGKLPHNKEEAGKEITEFDEHMEVKKDYLDSLSLSLILVSILPALGIFNYAFFAEKIQYKKKKEIYAVSQFYTRYTNVENERVSKYKPFIKSCLAGYIDTLLNQKSIYLSDNDKIGYFLDADSNNKVTIYDEPYRNVIDNIYRRTMPVFGELTIGNRAGDSAWRFRNNKDSIIGHFKNDLLPALPVKMSSRYQNPFYGFIRNFFPDGFLFILVIAALLFLEWKLIRATMTRLFLLNFSGKQTVNDQYLSKFFNDVSKDNLYCKGLPIPSPITVSFFKSEETLPLGQYQHSLHFATMQKRLLVEDRLGMRQEQYIMQMTHCFAPVYEKIWEKQSDEEKYFLFDLARDGYSNYKNSDIIFRLIYKGILVPKNFQIRFFSLSFRNYILSKKGSPEIEELKSKFATGGMWRSIRIPIFMLLAGFVVFFGLTQNDVTHKVTAFVSSLAAIGPLLIELIGKIFSRNKS